MKGSNHHYDSIMRSYGCIPLLRFISNKRNTVLQSEAFSTNCCEILGVDHLLQPNQNQVEVKKSVIAGSLTLKKYAEVVLLTYRSTAFSYSFLES